MLRSAARLWLLGALILGPGAWCAPQMHEASPDLPQDIAVSSAGQAIKVNGLRLTLFALQSALAPEAANARIVDSWSRSVPGDLPAAAHSNNWIVISRQLGTHQQVVQLTSAPGGGSVGWLSELDLAAVPERIALPALALPVGTRLMSATESGAGGAVPARQYTAWSPLSPSQVLRQLQQALGRERWQVSGVSMAALTARVRSGHDVLLALRRDTDDVQVVLGRSAGGTSLVINERQLVGGPSPGAAMR
jgi:hypothetical protein